MSGNDRQILHLHPAAPEKPALGQPCNGCGVCCAAEPCPLAMLLFRRRHGPCPALRWQDERYLCGLLAAPSVPARWLQPLVRRWIAAGKGCDSSAEIV